MNNSVPWRRSGLSAAFSLLELLVVVAIILVMTALAIPAFNAIKGGGDITKAAYDVAGALEMAATYARANNTYVWVGFFEEDPTVLATTPATAGVGRLVISIVCSKDGTQIVSPTGAGQAIPPGRLTQIGKLIKIDRMHFGDVPNPASPDPKGAGTSWDQRPSVVDPVGETYRIGQTTPANTAFPFQYPVGSDTAVLQYRFNKTIQFSPQGETLINTGKGGATTIYNTWPWLEIGLQPAHGNLADTAAKNIVAVQVAGINPQMRIYRK